MGTGEDADHPYKPSNFSLDTHPNFTYLLLLQPSLHFSQAHLAAMEQEFRLPHSIFHYAPLSNAIDLPCSIIPLLHAYMTDNENCDLLYNGTSATDEAEQSGSEQVVLSKCSKKMGLRNIFRGTQLIQLARAIDKCKPYLTSHSGVGEAWKATNRHLKANEFTLNVKYIALQNKAKALITYKEVHIHTVFLTVFLIFRTKAKSVTPRIKCHESLGFYFFAQDVCTDTDTS
jgi:hypothetical protein